MTTARTKLEAAEAMQRLHRAAARVDRQIRFMEVCGTHTVNAFRAGLHGMLPANVTLLSGPGCPVCVTSQGDIDQMIGLASRPGLILCTYGDMIRVTGFQGSLEDARAAGADVRVVYSALDAVKLAVANPGREVAFVAVGFETTAPATAVAVRAAASDSVKNFTVLASHKLVMPAMWALLDGGQVNVDGFICPGHVAIVIGSEAFRPIVEVYGLPCVITGFEGEQIAAALARLTEMVPSSPSPGNPGEGGVRVLSQREPTQPLPKNPTLSRNTGRGTLLENLYPQAVTPEGNRVAQQMLAETFEPVDAHWRGLGPLPASGLQLREAFAAHDAVRRFGLQPIETREPAGCRCGEVICGLATPAECRLFGVACTPVRPVGPCMVSSEGTCQAWFKYRRGGSRRVVAGGVA